MKAIRTLALLLSTVVPPASADTIAEWNAIALDAAARSGQPAEYTMRAMAMVHVAMFETLNVDLYPFQRPAFAATLKSSVHGGPGSPAIANGVAAGTSVAAAICTARQFDRPGVDPWALESASQLRPKGSPRPAANANLLTQEEAGPLALNAITSETIVGLTAIQRARTYALVSMAIADAHTAAHDARYSCTPCVAAAAVATVLDSLGAAVPAGFSGTAELSLGRNVGRQALLRYRAAD